MNMNTVIFCAGHYGIQLLNMIHKGLFSPEIQVNKDDIFFCDNNPEVIAKSYIAGCKVLSPDKIEELGKDTRIIISSPQNADFVMEQLHKIGVKHPVYYTPEYVYKFLWNTANMPPFVKMDIDKPRIKKLQIPIIELCNLNCRGCNLIYNLNSEKRMSVDEFIKTMKSLRKLFSGIKKLTLLGGEPFIHPDLKNLVLEARHYFSDSDLEIRTNGTQIFKLKDELLSAILETYTEIAISLYPPLIDKKPEIELFLRERNVRYRFLGPFLEFNKIFNPKGDYDGEEIHRGCELCTNLMQDELSCGLGHGIETLEEYYGVSLCKDEYKKLNRFNIHTTDLDGWEINRRLALPTRLCDFCAYQKKNDADNMFLWSCGTPKLEDWII